MNFSTSAHSNNISEEMIQSLQDWWSLAGVDQDYNDTPEPLLGNEAQTAQTTVASPPVTVAATESKGKTPETVIQNDVKDLQYPSDYEAFLDFIQDRNNLVEAGWSNQFILPKGPLQSKLMVIAALPDQSGSSEIPLYSNENAILLKNMLRAIGHDSQDVHFASIAMARPIEGRIQNQFFAPLKKRTLHHIGLVQPEKILLFGDTSAKLFFEEDLLTARKKKQNINHISSTTEAIVTFHPRILIERPAFKAEAWKDLQMLTRTSAS